MHFFCLCKNLKEILELYVFVAQIVHTEVVKFDFSTKHINFVRTGVKMHHYEW